MSNQPLYTRRYLPVDGVSGSLVADVIESSITCPINAVDVMIGYQELFLPSHINEVLICRVKSEGVIIKDIGEPGEG